jgi:hypothetical protein
MPNTLAYGSYVWTGQAVFSGNNSVLISAFYNPPCQVNIGLATTVNDLVTVPTCVVTPSSGYGSATWQLVIDDTIYPAWILEVTTFQYDRELIDFTIGYAPFSFVCFQ